MRITGFDSTRRIVVVTKVTRYYVTIFLTRFEEKWSIVTFERERDREWRRRRVKKS